MNHFNSSSKGYEYNPLVAKYEELRQQHKSFYLDPYEFIEIANFYLNQMNYDEAKEALINGLKIHRSNTNLLIELAHFYLEQENPDKVKEVLQFLESVYTFEVNIIRAEIALVDEENENKANQILSSSIDPIIDVDQKISAGQLFLMYQYPSKALSWLLPAYKMQENNIELLELLSRSYLMKMDFVNAAKFYDKLLNLVPYQTEYWNKLGHCYFLEEDYEAADEAYSFAITCDKKTEEAYIFGSFSLLYQEKEKEANQLLDKAVKEELISLPYKFYYLALFFYIQKGNIVKAYTELQKGIDLIRERGGQEALSYCFLYILCLINLGKEKEAKELSQKALDFYDRLFPYEMDELLPTMPNKHQFKELASICEMKLFPETNLYLSYMNQFLKSFNPLFWNNEEDSIFTDNKESDSDLYNPIQFSAVINRDSDIHHQLDQIYFEILLDSKKDFLITANNNDSHISKTSFIKSILENNPTLAEELKGDITNRIQNN